MSYTRLKKRGIYPNNYSNNASSYNMKMNYNQDFNQVYTQVQNGMMNQPQNFAYSTHQMIQPGPNYPNQIAPSFYQSNQFSSVPSSQYNGQPDSRRHRNRSSCKFYFL